MKKLNNFTVKNDRFVKACSFQSWYNRPNSSSMGPHSKALELENPILQLHEQENNQK